MSTMFDFVPPTLPQLASGAQFLANMAEEDPELQSHEEALQAIATALDDYDRARNEYDARNAHYIEWLNWYQQNPGGKAQIVEFADSHNTWFSSSRESLQEVAEAMARWEQASGREGMREEIQQIVEQATTDAQRLGQNAEAIRSSSFTAAQAEATKEPAIRPQKRQPEASAT